MPWNRPGCWIFHSVGSGVTWTSRSSPAVLMVQAAQKGQELTAEDAAARAPLRRPGRRERALVPQVMAQYEKDGVTDGG